MSYGELDLFTCVEDYCQHDGSVTWDTEPPVAANEKNIQDEKIPFGEGE